MIIIIIIIIIIISVCACVCVCACACVWTLEYRCFNRTAGLNHYRFLSGKFAAVDANGANSGVPAYLHSVPLRPTSNRSCLVFWYALYGSGDAGALRVVTSDISLGDGIPVWELDGRLPNLPTRNQWRRVAVTLNTPHPDSIRVSVFHQTHLVSK